MAYIFSDDGASQLKEGVFLEMLNLTCGDQSRNGLPCLSFSRATKTRIIKGVDGVFTPRQAITDYGDIGLLSGDLEFDVVAVVLAVGALDHGISSGPVGRAGGRRTVVLGTLDEKVLYMQVDTSALVLPFDPLKAQGVIIGAKNLGRPYISTKTGSVWYVAMSHLAGWNQ